MDLYGSSMPITSLQTSLFRGPLNGTYTSEGVFLVPPNPNAPMCSLAAGVLGNCQLPTCASASLQSESFDPGDLYDLSHMLDAMPVTMDDANGADLNGVILPNLQHMPNPDQIALPYMDSQPILHAHLLNLQ